MSTENYENLNFFVTDKNFISCQQKSDVKKNETLVDF